MNILASWGVRVSSAWISLVCVPRSHIQLMWAAVLWQCHRRVRITPPLPSQRTQNREILKCLCPHYTKWILVWMQQTDLFSTNVECSWLGLRPGPRVTGVDGTLVCTRSHDTETHCLTQDWPGGCWRQFFKISSFIFSTLCPCMM